MLSRRSIACALLLFAAISHAADSTPYSGDPILVPGRFEAEDFDKGGEGVAFHKIKPDKTSTYRPEPVMIGRPPRSPGIAYLSSTHAGEWFNYTINVKETGEYAVDILASSTAKEPGKFHIVFQGKDLTDPLQTPLAKTGEFARVRAFIKLNAGVQIMRLCMDGDGSNGFAADVDRFVISTKAVVENDAKMREQKEVELNANKIRELEERINKPLDPAAINAMLAPMAECSFRDHYMKEVFLYCRVERYQIQFASIVAMGRAALPALVTALSNNDPRIRLASADCISYMGRAEEKKIAAQALEKMWRELPTEQAAIALFLYSSLTDKLPVKLDPNVLDNETCLMLIRWLRFRPVPELEPDIVALLDSQDVAFRHACALYLCVLDGKSALNKAQQLMKNPEQESQYFYALIILRHAEARMAIEAMRWLARTDWWYMHQLTGQALAERTDKDMLNAHKIFINHISTFAQGDTSTVLHKSNYFKKLGTIGNETALSAMHYAAERGNVEVRMIATEGLVLTEDPRAINALYELSDDDYSVVSIQATASLLILARKNAKAKEYVAEIEQRLTLTAMQRVLYTLEYLVHDDPENAEKIARANPQRGFRELDTLLQTFGSSRIYGYLKSRKAGEALARWISSMRAGKEHHIKIACTLLGSNGDDLAEPLFDAARKLNAAIDEEPVGKVYVYKRLLSSEALAVKALSHHDILLRTGAAKKLAEIGTAAALPALELALSDPSPAYQFKPRLPQEQYWQKEPPSEDLYPVRVAARAAIEAIKARGAK